jgi:acetyl esterase/lipase
MMMMTRSILKRRVRAAGLAAACAAGLAMAAPAPAQPAAAADGTVPLDGVRVPLSDFLSPEAQAYLRQLILEHPFAGGPGPSDIKGERAHQDKIMRAFLAPMLTRYKVHIAEERIGGILTEVITPAEGVAPENRDRLLINVHGGGFTTGARSASLVESVPLAALMRIKVVSIDYRMGPEHSFPAASEDVATVYRALLETHAPEKMALYGCSAGGLLTAQSIAWFQTQGLPNPAAIGIFCASTGGFFGGDSMHYAGPLTNGPLPPRPEGDGARAAPPPPPGHAYLGKARADDPLVYPIASPAVLAKFPPTLFITGTRSFEFSAALNAHVQLDKAGVETRFHGWDGMFHGFFYNSELPESREAYDVMVRFFDKHLAR